MRIGGMFARAAATATASCIAGTVLCDGSETDRTRPQNPKTALVRYRKDTVVEACTTLPFATVLDPIPNCNTKHGMLCGTAVRCMLGMCWLEITRAYAFGLYVDSAVLRMLSQRKYEWTPGDADTGKEALATSKGEPAPSLFLLDNKTRQPKVWGEVSLALRMAQTIDGPHMADGFKRSVTKQLTLIQADVAAFKKGGVSRTGMDKRLARALDPDASKDLPEVELLAKAFLRLRELRKGEIVTLTWRQDGTLAMSAAGVSLPGVVLRRPAVIRALFDVYCGDNAVSAEGSEAFRSALVRMSQAVVEGSSVTDTVVGPMRA